MALPGTPVLMYGDEIGMGEDLSLPGRLAVRNPMQWSDRAAGGFSAADQLYRPARADGPFGYRTVNVAAQRHQPGSLYSWVARTIRVRRECPELGWGQWRTLPAGDPRVLAIETRWRDGCVVTLHNLSAERATARLPGDLNAPASSQDVVEILSDGKSPGTIGSEIELAGYGYRWLRLSDDSSPV
jgi:maltose alpha-D-glucosyltransferase/alpha-amylase